MPIIGTINNDLLNGTAGSDPVCNVATKVVGDALNNSTVDCAFGCKYAV